MDVKKVKNIGFNAEASNIEHRSKSNILMMMVSGQDEQATFQIECKHSSRDFKLEHEVHSMRMRSYAYEELDCPGRIFTPIDKRTNSKFFLFTSGMYKLQKINYQVGVASTMTNWMFEERTGPVVPLYDPKV